MSTRPMIRRPRAQAFRIRDMLAEQIGPANRNDPIIHGCLNLIDAERVGTTEGLCMAIRYLSEQNERLMTMAIRAEAAKPIIMEMAFKDSAYANEMIHKAVELAARVKYLEMRVIEQRETIERMRREQR